MRDGRDLDGGDPGVRWIADELRRAGDAEPVDTAAVERVMRRVRERPRPRRDAAAPPAPARARPASRQPAWRWLVRSRPVSLSPLAGAALAASIAGVGALGTLGALRLSRASASAIAAGPESWPASATTLATADAPARTVRFVLVAPGVSRVSVVGDFNGWDAAVTPLRRDAADRWSVEVPLPAGRYVYAFVLDGRRWVPDPAAPLAPEDGFGTPNSVVVVGPAT
jgi:hypothetical protein